MSVKVMQWAWEQAIPNSSRKLILLALADRANDDGECWPGITSLTDKCSIPRRTLIRALHDLEAQGFLSVKHRAGDGSGRKTNIYQLNTERPTDQAKRQADTRQSAKLAPSGKVPNQQAKCQSDTRQSAKLALRAKCQNEGAKCQSDTRQSAKSGGAKCQSLAPNTSVDSSTRKPSGEPSVCGAQAPNPLMAPPSMSRGKRQRRATPVLTFIPDDFGITPELQAWADKKGYGDLEQHLESFKDKAIAKGYQYTDWNAAFRNAIRDDWAKLRNVQPLTQPSQRNRPRGLPPQPSTDPRVAEFEAILQNLNARSVIEGECHVAH